MNNGERDNENNKEQSKSITPNQDRVKSNDSEIAMMQYFSNINNPNRRKKERD